MDAPLPSPLPDIVARVNGQPIAIGQVLALAKKGLVDSNDRARDMPRALRQALHDYVDRELLLQEALARGLRADTARVETAFDQVRAQFPSEQAWRDSLAEQGLDVQSYKQELRSQETVNALLREEADKVRVSAEEVKGFFEANPRAVDPAEKLVVQELFFAVGVAGPRAREAARVRAAVAQKRAESGEDFAALVKEVSADPAAFAKGGKVEVTRGARPPVYERAAYALAVGQVSKIVDAPDGVYVLKLEGRVPGPPPAFDAVKGEIESAFLAEKRQAAVRSLVASLRAKARIETFL
jgi:parvulin-like peptidyl-prolyl isomerase